MKSKIRILHLEDDPKDAEMVQALLKQEDWDLEITTIATRQALETALREAGFDLIISDYSMGSFDGLSALQIAQTTHPDVPFILVSGAIGEDRAVEALKRGAIDYLLKDHLSRLVSSVKRALHETAEIAASKQATRRLNAQHAVTRILAESAALEEAAPKILRVIRESLGWAVGTMWRVDRPAGVLRCVEISNASTATYGEFEALSRQTTFAAGIGLPGRVWANGQPAWISDVVRDPNFPRAPTARKAGLHSAFAFPIRLAREITGVIEFFTPQVQEPDDDLLSMMDALGTQIGLFIERKRAEAELRLFRNLLDQSNDFIFVVEPSTARFLDVNNTACTSLGYTHAELLGMKILDIKAATADGFSWDTHVRETKAKGSAILEAELKRKDGSTFPVEVNVKYVVQEKADYMVAVVRDITEQKKQEARALRAQRMESIGTLASGIAHDLNNVLAPIMMAVETLKRKLTDPQSQQMLTMLANSTQRGADIVKQVLSFARGVEGKRVELQPKHVLLEVEKIARETFPKSIEIVRRIPNNLWIVAADATQLHQVFMNLCINARDAMPAGGRLTLAAENLFLDEKSAKAYPGAKPGEHVVVTVTDTGLGIPANLLGKIFDPFFTTKEIGKGTGLGLATVAGIVKGHGGVVSVESEVGKGSRFKVYLPKAAGQAAIPDRKVAPDLPPGHGEMILVVDDEAAICESVRRALESNGFRVITVHDGTEAVAAYVQHQEEVKLVLTDMMMPFMDGVATIRTLRKINPKVKIIACGGLVDDVNCASLDATVGLKVQAFLQKPFDEDKLLRAIHDALATQ